MTKSSSAWRTSTTLAAVSAAGATAGTDKVKAKQVVTSICTQCGPYLEPRVCLRYMKSQTPSTKPGPRREVGTPKEKLQTNLKFQCQMTETGLEFLFLQYSSTPILQYSNQSPSSFLPDVRFLSRRKTQMQLQNLPQINRVPWGHMCAARGGRPIGLSEDVQACR